MEPTERVLGFYRAKVIDNRDDEQFGRVKVWIPALMHTIDENEGLWARAANNPVGGRNTREGSGSYYYGTCYIPRVGSYVLVFFEAGNINKPYYFASLEIETSKVLPENQVGSNFQDKWTIFKSPDGRCIVISDDPSDARVEITGKKRMLTSPPTGDTESVYQIDGNQTTILMDERSGQEKVLIRTYQGDFVNINVADRKLEISFFGDVNIKSLGSIYLTANGKVRINAGGGIETETSGDCTVKAKQTKSTAKFFHSMGRSWINPLRGVRRVSQSTRSALNPKPGGDRG